MKTEFKAKFLQHLAQKRQDDKGFTLIELLVVIIIIGILSAIALPSFLNQANKAKQSEAKQNVGSMNRAQQAYYLENSAFASTVTNLGLGIQTQTVNYLYTISGVQAGATSAATPDASVVIVQGTSLKKPLKHYVGRVELGTVVATSEATTLAILCESLKIQQLQPANVEPSSTSVSTGCTTNGKILEAK